MFSANNSNNSQINPNQNLMVQGPPTDTVSHITFCGNNSAFFSVCSWDKKVRFYQLQNGQAGLKSETILDAPSLCSYFTDDGKVFCSGCDNKGYMWDLNTGNKQQIAQHNDPIPFISFVQEHNLIMTGSWDSTLKYWDGRQANAAATINLDAPFGCGDVRGNLFVCSTGFNQAKNAPKVLVYDLKNPATPFSSTTSLHPNYVCKTIRTFPDMKGYAMGTIEGRVQICYIDSKQATHNFAYKCHRQDSQVYAINEIAFHNTFGTFATCGSDGNIVIWDKENRTKVKSFKKMPAPITAAAFSKDGNVFAYASGYDWSQGPKSSQDLAKMAPQIFLHDVKEIDVKNKKKTASRGSL